MGESRRDCAYGHESERRRGNTTLLEYSVRNKPIPKNGRRGSVLLLVVITMSMLSMFAIGATENSRTLINTAITDRSILHARLAAESALQYSHRQLTLDKDWVGTGRSEEHTSELQSP